MLEQRTAELSETLSYQAAIGDVLRVISESPSDVAPVFESIMDSARRLLGTSIAAVFRYDGSVVHLVATRGWSADALDDARRLYPGPPTPKMLSGRVILSGRVQTISDAHADPHYDVTTAHIGQWRRMIGAPMLRDGAPVGVVVVAWADPGETPARQSELLQTFADQAAIAVENVRLFNETRETLDRQTATAEVLQAISGSVADTAPVFDKILLSCKKLFDSNEQGILMIDADGKMQFGAHHGSARAQLEALFPAQLSPETLRGMAERGPPLHSRDARNDPDAHPQIRNVARALDIGAYSQVLAQMVWQGRAVGLLYVIRQPATGFSEKEIDLLKTFADQAVIAIQNARLFADMNEALEQQRASSEVLSAISRSVADTQPVFDSILHSCERLFGGSHAVIDRLGDDGAWHLAAYAGPHREALEALYPIPVGDADRGDADILSRRVTHYPDVARATGMPAKVRLGCEIVGCRSLAMAPMVSEAGRLGTILVGRHTLEPFTPKETALLLTFADQAVIAIRNAHLFDEIQTQQRELEQANQHKSEFLANMSHELRTPLNAIIGFSEVLAEQMFGGVNDKQLEYLRDIHASGHHLLTLINDILDLSKIEAGRMELDLAQFNVAGLLDDTMTLLRERSLRQGLTLTLDVDEGLGDWVADPRKVKQIVINLLTNAVKFTPAGGRVTLSARARDAAVEIAVIDTGVGIAPDQQALVFEAFRQAGGDVLRKAEGTGLGLSLARRFVELHGGTMRLDSAPGRGSTFAFMLPQRELQADA